MTETNKLSLKDKMKSKMNLNANSYEFKQKSAQLLQNNNNLPDLNNLSLYQQSSQQYQSQPVSIILGNQNNLPVQNLQTSIPVFDVNSLIKNEKIPKMTKKLKSNNQSFIPQSQQQETPQQDQQISNKNEQIIEKIQKIEKQQEEDQQQKQQKPQVQQKKLKLPSQEIQAIFNSNVLQNQVQQKQCTSENQKKTAKELTALLNIEPKPLDASNNFHKIIIDIQKRQEMFEQIKQKKQNNPNKKQHNQQKIEIKKGENFIKNQKENNEYQSNYDFKRSQPDELKIKLQEQANKWTDQNKAEKDQIKINQKRIKIVLNKITPETYEKLYQELFDLCCESKEINEEVAELILKKSWEDKNYSKLYAQLCKQLSEQNQLNFKTNENLFRKEMMSKIQKTFEGEIKVFQVNNGKLESEMTKEEKAELILVVKRRTLNNHRFIGELYNSKFLNRIIIYNCLFSQLLIFNQYYFDKKINLVDNRFEDQLEGLLLILEIIGKKLEQELNTNSLKSKAKYQDQDIVDNIFKALDKFYLDCKNTQNKNQYLELKDQTDIQIIYANKKFLDIEQIFQILILIREKCDISQRMQSLIAVLIQKKNENWEERFFKGEGPKTLNQIQEEHARQQEIIDERAESNYQKRSKNYQDSFHQKVYDNKQQQNFDEVVYVAKGEEENTMRRKRKQSYVGLPAHEIEDRIKEMNKKLDNGRVDVDDTQSKPYSVDDYHKEGHLLVTECDNIVFIEKYLQHFSDGRKDNIYNRLGLIKYIYDQKLILIKEIINEISNNLQKHWEIADDYPEMTNSYATIIYQFTQQSLFKVDKINFKLLNTEDPDLKDMKKYFFETVLEKLIKKYEKGQIDQELKNQFVNCLKDMEVEDQQEWLKQYIKE